MKKIHYAVCLPTLIDTPQIINFIYFIGIKGLKMYTELFPAESVISDTLKMPLSLSLDYWQCY